MVKFVDLEKGFIYDGHKPYIFWFNDGLSTDLIYTKSIGVFSNKSMINISLPSNSVFKLINIEELLKNVNDYKSSECLEYTSTGSSVPNGYLHIIYLSACSNENGEFHESLYIDNEEFEVGADFYVENESMYINLSNFGIEIPDSIQKAIYESNIQEDKKDNILLNRKFKELMSNYWDMLANKGSYKSLMNSLKWFEWGDIVRINEVWKQYTAGKTELSTNELTATLNELYRDRLINFAKTTYIALYASMQEMEKEKENGQVLYDNEMNPMLKNIVALWTKEEMSLKMSLLGNFYKNFFMPIHLDLLHSTIEDIVFTNNEKILKGSIIDRTDQVFNFEYVSSNVDNTENFFLGNVRTQVGPDTIFGVQWNGEEKYDDVYTIGVEDTSKGQYANTMYTDAGIKTFGSQLYTGVGVVIPVEIMIPMHNNDFIKRTTISVGINDKWNTKVFATVFKPVNNICTIKFNLLCKVDGEWEVRFLFLSGDSKTYVKNLKFNIIDPSTAKLNIYRILHKFKPKLEDLMEGDNTNEFVFRRYFEGDNLKNATYTQYLPVSKDGGGIKLNHLIVMKGDWTEDTWLNDNYFMISKVAKHSSLKSPEEDFNEEDMDQLYTICISKKFNFRPKSFLNAYKTNNMIKNTYTYIPQFHQLLPLKGDTLLDYTISDDIPICIKPDIKFGKFIKDWEWEFENASTLEVIKLPSIQEPFVASTRKELLPSGYYNIKFKYSLIDGQTNEIRITSAFLKK